MPSASLAWLAGATPGKLEVSAGSQGVIAQIPPPVLGCSRPFGPFAGEVRKATRQAQLHEGLDSDRFACLTRSMETLCLEAGDDRPRARDGDRFAYQHCGRQQLHRYTAEFEFRYNHRIGGITPVMKLEMVA